MYWNQKPEISGGTGDRMLDTRQMHMLPWRDFNPV